MITDLINEELMCLILKAISKVGVVLPRAKNTSVAMPKATTGLFFEFKVETIGSIEVRNSPTREELDCAESIVISSDKQIDIIRFAGRKLARKGLMTPVTGGKGVINKAPLANPYEALGGDYPEQRKAKPLRHILTCTASASHIIPIVVSRSLMIPIMSGYIAFSIADLSLLTPG